MRSANPPPRGGDTVPADDGAPSDEAGPPLEVIVGDESSEAPSVAARPATPPARQRDDDGIPAPPLAELSARVPPVLQEAMEELFRARFVRVARVPVSAPKAES